jgi:hypothetical protein
VHIILCTNTIPLLRRIILKNEVKSQKLDKKEAEALLEYIAMEECRTKKIIETLCGSELEKYFKWLDAYCEEHNCSHEEGLNRLI